MYDLLQKINERPKPFEFYTADDLWTDQYRSEQMLKYHLMEDVDISSRRIEFIDCSVKWITERFNIGSNSRIADFGCGPGLYATRLAQTGAKVTGIDFSHRSIEYAKRIAAEKNLSIDYINQNYLQYKTEKKFDLITMIMCDFCVLSPDQRQTMLSKFKDILKDNGSILLDLNSIDAFNKREKGAIYEKNQLNKFWSAEDYYGFLNTFKYENEKVILDKYTIIEPSRTYTIYNWFQFYSTDEIKKEFNKAGLNITEQYADVAGTPFDPNSDEFAVVATKR